MPKSPLYDLKSLLIQVGKGDEPAFRTVFDLCKERFYIASLRMTRSTDTAEEIVQEVFVTLWMKRLQVAKAVNPENYLLTVLHNCIYAHFRKLAREKALKEKMVEQVAEADSSPVEEILFAKENRQMLESVINRLPSQQRMVFKLSRQQGLTREEIAEQMHISPNTVKNHLQNAVEFIRNYYKAGASAFIWTAVWQCML